MAKLKSGLKNIPKGAKGKLIRQGIASQAKQILSKINELKGNKYGHVKTLSVIKDAQLTKVTEARKIIKERRTALKAEIKTITDSVKMGRIAGKQAVDGLQKSVDANRSNITALREKLKSLPK